MTICLGGNAWVLLCLCVTMLVWPCVNQGVNGGWRLLRPDSLINPTHEQQSEIWAKHRCLTFP